MNTSSRINPSPQPVPGRRRWLKWIMLAAAVIIVGYCMPRNREVNFSFTEGTPWSNDLLTASMTFTVPADPERVSEAEDSLREVFVEVYCRDASSDKLLIAEVSRRIEENADVHLSPGERNRLLSAIRRVTEAGIVDQATYADIRAGRLRTVRMIHDNTAVSIPTTNYLSPKAAYARIDSLLSDRRYRDATAAINLADLLQPNVVLDSVNNKRMFDERLRQAVSSSKGYVKGERIIDRGEVVDHDRYLAIKAYEDKLNEMSSTSEHTVLIKTIGSLAFLFLLYACLYSFLFFYRRDYFGNTRTMAFLMLIITSFILLGMLLDGTFHDEYGIYLTPFAIVAIVTLVFLDSRTAFFAYTLTILGTMCVVGASPQFFFVQWVAGVVAINSIRELSKRSELIRTAAFIFLACVASFFAYGAMSGGTLPDDSWKILLFFLINAIFISFTYIMVFLLEKVFGFTSRVTLVELSDINHPLLRDLSEECPGTFQHSMAVSNLATAAANRIGAKVQLVRAGALYHDIGKIANPAFFTENQRGVNPHDALDPLQSAKIVIGHVAEGLRRAEKAKLPKVLRDFIAQHHGKGKARYFYNTYCNNHPGEEVDPAPFTYPGPNPTTREASILMMADAVEAASRSLTDHSNEAVTALVNRIIDTQVDEGMHNDSPISFRDISEIKATFISRLATMFHGRIPYPELKKKPAEPTNS